jgi:hypothetical protein
MPIEGGLRTSIPRAPLDLSNGNPQSRKVQSLSHENVGPNAVELNDVTVANSMLCTFFPFPVRSIIRQNLDLTSYLKVAGVNLGGVRFASWEKLNGSYFWCFDDWSHGYFHWLFDVLPKLIILAELHGPHKVILPEHFLQQKFITQSLGTMGLEAVPLHPGVIYRVSRVYSYRSYPYYVADLLLKTRSYFLQRYNVSAPAQGKRNIYISRRKAARRRVSNEPALIDTIEKCGFEIFSLEDMSFHEQIALFSQARNVIGLHGAGFANILFSPGLTAVCEIRSRNFTNDVFEKLAGALGVEYSTVEIDSDETDMLLADFELDKEDLERKLLELTG